MKKCLSFLVAIFCLNLAIAQTGTVAGKIIEKDSGFEVIGGNVLVVGSDGQGTASDLDGNYTLKLAPGTYSLEFSYIGFASQTIADIVVLEGELTQLDIQLFEDAVELDIDVVVTAKASRNSEGAMLLLQKKSAVVMDGISANQISKSGDSNVAAAVKRVSGVSIEGGKYVYVRGLGDRYSKTTLNNAEVPGLDPNRNAVQMDLFPTNLIDNIVVYKTFSPNLPGDFSGGLIDITTKDFPEQFNIAASASLSYNSNANFNKNFLTSPGGQNDDLGFDDGTRAVPELITENIDALPNYSEGLNDPQKGQQLSDLTNSFNNNWSQQQERKFLNQSYSISAGNQKSLFGKPLGFNMALSYSKGYSGYQNGMFSLPKLTGKVATTERLNTQVSLTDINSGSENVLWGALVGASLKLNSNNKISLNVLHNQSGMSGTEFAEGVKRIDDGDDVFQTRTWQYLERALSTAQLSGKHVFTDKNNFQINWLSSFTLSTQEEPDLRFFTNRYLPEDDRYFIKPSSDGVPIRNYRDMTQSNWDNKINLILPFTQWSGLKSELKVGGSFVMRQREFRESRYNFNNQSASLPNGDITAYFEQDNILQIGEDGTYTNSGAGVYFAENNVPANNYDASSEVLATYAMVDLPLTKKLRVITGLRVENPQVRLLTFDESLLVNYAQLDGESNLLKGIDFLPALNLNYEIGEKAKLRFAYSKTVARPTFRELAPFASFTPARGVTVGNPELKRSQIDNVDLRYEMFPASGEVFSVSAFYKNFVNPIEATFNTKAQNPEFTWRNVDQAFLLGGEIEIKKKLGFIGKAFSGFSAGANFAYIYSRTTIDEEEMELILADDPEAVNYREMFGQAPYSFNAILSFRSNSGATNVNLSYNVVGPRIITVASGATPNYYLQPQPSLNFNLSQELNDRFKIKVSGQNLLNSKYQEMVTYKGEEYPVNVFQLGRTYALGLSYRFTK